MDVNGERDSTLSDWRLYLKKKRRVDGPTHVPQEEDSRV